ncbi:MAG: branched-chain alpha-keto acid dehydrogenase subunit E2 [Verrucomicrobia bacterium]|jgi:pyruvate dehydrogenase E2 component (dihydrolipoamide acetyltransferase)|nr:branched-chain alpha-keto acid dehydrogenase subunit E2 [Verrucomicrobiota bacterium]
METEFKLPVLGENIESIQVVRVMVAAGDTIAVDQPVLELETDKATIEVPSSVAGVVSAVKVSEGDDVEVGQVVLTLEDGGPSERESESEETAVAEAVPAEAEPSAPAAAPIAGVEPTVLASKAPPPEGGSTVPAAPSVRKFAREIGIVLSDVPASGPHGRVSKDDVKRYAKQLNESRGVATSTGTAVALPPLPDFSQWGAVESKKMSVIRYKTAEHMALSWSQVPHVTIHDKVDITELEGLRKQYADLALKQGGKLTMAVMVCKVVAQALAKFPAFNASVDMASKQIIYKQYVNLGVAVGTPRGLMVPVIRDADQKNMVQLSVEIQSLAAKCRDGKIQLSELEGGTFTVTNLGRICGTHFTPIVNYPEVAILGMGRSYDEGLVVGGSIEERTVLPLSLSFDHRVIDGSDGAAFMGWIKEAIQQPLLLALEG